MNDVFGVGREGGRRGERKCLCCTESQMLKASGSERRGDDTHLFEKTTVVKESTLWGGSVGVCVHERARCITGFLLSETKHKSNIVDTEG